MSCTKADALLARVDLLDAAHRPIHTYSKGMMQRIGLAQPHRICETSEWLQLRADDEPDGLCELHESSV